MAHAQTTWVLFIYAHQLKALASQVGGRLPFLTAAHLEGRCVKFVPHPSPTECDRGTLPCLVETPGWNTLGIVVMVNKHQLEKLDHDLGVNRGIMLRVVHTAHHPTHELPPFPVYAYTASMLPGPDGSTVRPDAETELDWSETTMWAAREYRQIKSKPVNVLVDTLLRQLTGPPGS